MFIMYEVGFCKVVTSENVEGVGHRAMYEVGFCKVVTSVLSGSSSFSHMYEFGFCKVVISESILLNTIVYV